MQLLGHLLASERHRNRGSTFHTLGLHNHSLTNRICMREQLSAKTHTHTPDTRKNIHARLSDCECPWLTKFFAEARHRCHAWCSTWRRARCVAVVLHLFTPLDAELENFPREHKLANCKLSIRPDIPGRSNRDQACQHPGKRSTLRTVVPLSNSKSLLLCDTTLTAADVFLAGLVSSAAAEKK